MSIVLTNKHLEKLSELKESWKSAEFLQFLSNYELGNPSAIKKYHDLLLFHCAFPANKVTYELATTGLKRVSEVVEKICERSNRKSIHSLVGSGIAHSELFCSYSGVISQWICKKFPGSVELGYSDASPDTTRNILQSLLPAIEYEKSTQGELGLPARLTLISNLPNSAAQLRFLLQLFEKSRLPDLVREELYQQLKVFIRWKLDNEIFNRSFLRCPFKAIFYQEAIVRDFMPHKIVKQKLTKRVTLSLSGKTYILDVMKGSLAFHYRETDPVTYGDTNELELFDMGRGLQIALVGMTKEKRLSLESYIGYMAFKNGVPVSYGGGWIWGQRCKIGVNIYPPFRHGESAWLFCQVLRIYYQHFGVRHFIVKPYQFGKSNPEGLKTGAFWFYYKLGFRPSDENIKAEAENEWKKIKANKNYRTPLTQLRRFTHFHKEWILVENPSPGFDAGKLSNAVSHFINTNFRSNRQRAITHCLYKLKINFPARSLKNNNPAQIQVLKNWSLLTGIINDFTGWSSYQKKSLIQLIHLKQAGKEKDYIIRLQKHEQLWRSLKQAINNPHNIPRRGKGIN